MSSSENIDILSQPADNVKPQMPNAAVIAPSNPVDRQAGTTSAAPNIPTASPPNVTGGDASFSSVTSAIQQLVTSKTAELDAGMKAAQANTAIDQSANTQIIPLQDSTMAAYMNIQKAQSLPGGADSKLAKIIGIFDSDYNVPYQRTQAEINTIKTQSVTARAAALKEQNNALPALLSKVSEASKVIFDAQKDANDLAIKQGTLDNQVMNTKISAARLRIEMSAEARAGAKFKIESMTTDQLSAALPQAQAGKGPLAHLGGLIEERLVSEQAAMTSLGNAQLALKKGNREDYNDSMIDAVSHFPVDYVTGKLKEAQTAGNPFVEMPTGTDPKTGKAIMGQVPINLVQQAVVKNTEIQNKVNTTLAADYTQRLNIIPTTTNLMNVGNAFAGINPKATQIVTNLGHVMKQMNTNDPNSVRQVGLVTQDLQKQMDDVVASEAKKYATPEAQAAIKTFGQTGKFDSQGAGSVISAVAGDVSLNNPHVSKFSNAWTNLNTQIATQIASEHLTGGAPAASANGQVDAMALINQLTAKQGGREKIQTIADNIMSDPNKTKVIVGQVKGKLQADTINGTLGQLASQKDADPVWGDLYNSKGNLDARAMFEKLEQKSLISGGKINYPKILLDGLGNYALNAANAPASDPTYTLQDHALIARLFGSNPSNVVAGDLHYQLRILASKTRKEMQARVQQDVTGQTQKQAFEQAGIQNAPPPAFAPSGLDSTQVQNTLRDKHGFDVNAVPSATGVIGLTAAQIKQMFPSGYN